MKSALVFESFVFVVVVAVVDVVVVYEFIRRRRLSKLD
jgi:hypothetical protein